MSAGFHSRCKVTSILTILKFLVSISQNTSFSEDSVVSLWNQACLSKICNTSLQWRKKIYSGSHQILFISTATFLSPQDICLQLHYVQLHPYHTLFKFTPCHWVKMNSIDWGDCPHFPANLDFIKKFFKNIYIW